MTPTIALIAVSLISAGLCVAVGIMQWRINQLNAENDLERARHEVTNELLTEALNEAKVENDLRRQAERNLAEANDEVDTWRARAMRAENALSKYTRQRDPKTGRFVKPDWVSDESREAASKALEKAMMTKPNSPTLIETDGLTARVVAKDPTPEHMRGEDVVEAAFNSMMGNPIQQLEGLTVRKLCDEVKENAGSGI